MLGKGRVFTNAVSGGSLGGSIPIASADCGVGSERPGTWKGGSDKNFRREEKGFQQRGRLSRSGIFGSAPPGGSIVCLQ